jgi:hypothetical protein
MKTIWTATQLLLLLGLVAVAFGTVVPADRHSTPYLAALSNIAVGTAEAVPCNNLKCHGGVCDTWEFSGCGIQNGHCKSTPCFP